MAKTLTRYHFSVEIFASLLLLSYPILMLAVKGGMNGTFLFMLLLAIFVWVVRPSSLPSVVWQHAWTPYVVAMLSLSIAIFISQSAHQSYTGHPHDAASRFWLAIPIFLLLQRLHLNVFATLQIAFPVAAITGFLLASNYAAEGARWRLSTMDEIHFGDFEMLLGVLSLLSINWLGRDKIPLKTLKLLGFVAGLAASFASGSRGGWLAIPLFVVIFIYFKTTKISPRMIVAALFLVISLSIPLYFFNAQFGQRVDVSVAEITALYRHENSFSSLSNRSRLFKAAVEIFLRHPIVGVGPEGFALEMQPLVEKGELTPLDAEYGRGEVHNDILSKATGMGIFGLIAMLAIYFVPLRFFWRATKSVVADVRCAGILGLTFVSGFFVFGLTLEVLNLTMAAAFYSFTVAVLLAACYNIHHGEWSVQRKLEQGQRHV